MKTHNKLFTMLSAVLFSLSCCMFLCNTNADTYDRAFTFRFTDKYEGRQTGPQTKDNDSSLYMWYASAGPTYYDAKAIGYTNPSQYEWTDCSGGYHYRFYHGQRRFMYNYIKENGYSAAGIYGFNQSSEGTASGYWSPDSVDEAGVLPASDYLK